MNRIHKIIWSAIKDKWIVVSEKAGASGSPIIQRGALSIAAFIAMTNAALAISPTELPTGGAITASSGAISTSGSAMTVNQTSQKMVADWNTFNIGEQASVTFSQPNTSAAALNRIHDLSPSQIMGKLTANGQVYLLNSSGILFGKTAQVNVGGLVATSLDMTDSDFLAGTNRFSNGGGAGSVLNEGSINAPGGVVALIAPQVSNTGTIKADGGSAALLAGDKVTVDFGGDGLINYVIDEGAVQAQVDNHGLIQTDGGLAVMSAKAASNLTSAAVNNTGIVRARTLENRDGKIVLVADMQSGVTSVAGTIDASAPNGGNGGFIETSGATVKIADGVTIDTRAAYGSTGTWLIDPSDFTITDGSASQTTSGIGATTLSANLANTDVTLQTDSGGAGNGDIFVNGTVSWSANQLTLSADRNIEINSEMNATGTASLALEYGQGAQASGNTALVDINAPVNLPEGNHFSTKLGYDGATVNYVVITSLGVEDSTTGTDLQGMNGNLAGNYVLGANIDASATQYWNSDGSGGYYGFSPIGNYSSRFTGVFNGLGHTISGLTINRPSQTYVGLFGYVGSGGAISNVGLLGGSVSGNNGVIGGLVGWNDGTVTSSYATGSVSGFRFVGGLVGYNSNGTVTQSYATGAVSGTGNYVGGLVGYNSNGTVTQSYATGAVSGTRNYVGGLVGYNDGTVEQSYATGSVSGSNLVGGLVGYNYSGSGTVTSSYATGSVSGSYYVGGLVGANDDGSTVSSSYATGAVMGSGDYVGGLVGYNDGTVEQSYATGAVMGSGDFVGGLVGWNDTDGMVTSSYWDTTTSGTTTGVGASDGTGVTGLTTAKLAGSLPTGFEAAVWGNADNQTTPYLLSHAAFSNTSGTVILGTDTSATPTYYSVILNVTQLQNINDSLAKNYVLGSNIDASATSEWNSGEGFSPIGTFFGSFDGLGHTISNLTINRPTQDYVGLFGYVGSGGAISNVGLEGGAVTGNDYVGGLVGSNVGTVTQSYATGLVSGSNYVGGLVGRNDRTVTQSYATGAVTGNNYVGGLVGYNYSGTSGTVTQSYATGAVTGNDYVGGLVGWNYGNVTQSYATGLVSGPSNVGGLVGKNVVGRVSSSYWDTETTGQASSAGGEGKTTEEMQTLTTFSDAEWSISANGGEDTVWRIYDGQTYPLLRSFLTPLTITANDATKTYDGLAYSGGAGVTYEGFRENENQNNLLGSLSYGGSSQNAINAGEYAIVPSGYYSQQDGYDITNVAGQLMIDPATLTYEAAASSRTYGDANPTFSGEITGWKNGETQATATTGTLSWSTTATATSNVGSYDITGSGLEANNGNYEFAQADGNATALTITPATLTVTANDDIKTYNRLAYRGGNGVTYSGFVNGETSSVLDGTLTYGGSSQGAVYAGTYSIVPSGLTSANYAINYVNGTLTINATWQTPVPELPPVLDPPPTPEWPKSRER